MSPALRFRHAERGPIGSRGLVDVAIEDRAVHDQLAAAAPARQVGMPRHEVARRFGTEVLPVAREEFPVRGELGHREPLGRRGAAAEEMRQGARRHADTA